MRDWLKAGAEIPDDPELAVDLTSPGYDTARGVESAAGIKDHDLVRAFVRTAKEAP